VGYAVAKNKVTTATLIDMKARGEKIVALTAYDFLLAELLDEVGIDLILVGDSLGTVFAGYESTVPVTMDQMLYHTRIVAQHAHRPLVVGDMPFMSYQASAEQAVVNAGRFLQDAGAQAVKLEGGEEVAEVIRRITNAGIPVVGHLGVTPQSVHQLGGYGVRGRSDAEAERMLSDARVLEDAGAFSIVLEKIPRVLAREVTEAIRIPTIGIGAGPECDGQILVTHDMLGLFERFRPKFARRYATLLQIARGACARYVDDVRTGRFPADQESF